MSKCAERLAAFIEGHADEMFFHVDLRDALETYRDQLPCQPDHADLEQLEALLRAGQGEHGGPKRSITRGHGRLDDWEEADGGRLDDWDA